jgi:hypothetical protein
VDLVSEEIPQILRRDQTVVEFLNVDVSDRPRLKGRDRRTQNLSTKLTQSEEAELQKASASVGKTLSEWARDVLLGSARGTAATVEQPTLLTEIVGIQLFLMNVLSPLTRGEHLSPEQYQTIIKGVQANKGRTAHQLLVRRLNAEER